MQEIAFYTLALIIVACSLGVVVLQSPVYGALCLVTALLGVAGIFALLGAHFLAAAQIAVYAGAIVVLFLFVLMLLNVKREDYGKDLVPLAVLAAAAGIPFVAMLLPIFESAFNFVPTGTVQGTVQAIGERLFSERYLVAFEAASVLLIAALLAAVMLGKRAMHRREE